MAADEPYGILVVGDQEVQHEGIQADYEASGQAVPRRVQGQQGRGAGEGSGSLQGQVAQGLPINRLTPAPVRRRGLCFWPTESPAYDPHVRWPAASQVLFVGGGRRLVCVSDA